MRPIVQLFFARLPGPGLRMWAQQSFGPTPVAAMTPEEVAVPLRAKISDALMVEPSLSGLPVTPTVRMPLWPRDPVMIELSGSVPRPALRQAAIDVVLREVESTGRGCALQDRIAVTSARLGRAA